LSTDFERCVSIFFSLDCLLFVSRLLRCVQTFELRFDFLFPACLSMFCFSMFLQFFNFLLVCPILFFKDPTIVNARGRLGAIQRPTNTMCRRASTPTNEILSRIKTFSSDPFRSDIHFGKTFSRSSSRAAGYFSPRSDWLPFHPSQRLVVEFRA